MRRGLAVSFLIVVTASAVGHAQGRRGATQGPPNIVGAWTGSWSSYNPARATAPPQEQCKKLDAKVAQRGAVWEATFEGDCGRPYKYSITMDGRQSGGAVMFKGTADLGAQDGGVYDWIGRAVDNEFVGFYTNAYGTGVFSLTKVP